MRAILFVTAASILFCSATAQAHWKPEYADASPATQDWYKNLRTTPETFAATGYALCCDHADTVKAQFRSSKIVGQQQQWWYLEDGTVGWKQIPPKIILWDEHAPDSEAKLFKYSGKELCFVPPSGGI